MPVLVNNAPITLSTGPTATAATVTRSSATTGWPGDSNGPPAFPFVCVLNAGTTYENVLVNGGYGTTTIDILRAVSPTNNGVQTAEDFSGGSCTMTPILAAPLGYDETVLHGLSLAPVLYWKCNEAVGATSVTDYSGNGYTGTVSGTVTFGVASIVPTDAETCCQGDGSTGYIATASAPALVPTGGPITTLAVVGCSSLQTTAYGGVITLGSSSFSILLGTAGNPSYQVNNSTVNAAWPIMGSAHVFGHVYDGQSESVLVDGVGVSSRAMTGTWTAAQVYALTQSAGTNCLSLPAGRFAIFAGVLTPADWRSLMQAFTGVL